MSNKGLLKRMLTKVSGKNRYQEVDLQEPCLLGRSAVRVPLNVFPIQVKLARAHVDLVICPEILLDDLGEIIPGSFLIYNAGSDLTEIQGFIRLDKKGDSLVLGNQDELQTFILNYPDEMDLRRLHILHDGDGLIFKSLVFDAEIHLSSFEEDLHQKTMEQRWGHLHRIRSIYGGSVKQLSAHEDLATLTRVNEILENEAYRPLDTRGMPGGLVELPGELTPVIVGDLHARVDNLLTLLSQNAFLEALDAGTAALVILGDAVHSELDGELDMMDSSLLIMDLIFRLKLHYPKQVFYIRGNHDSFSDSVFKAGIAQCLVWEQTIRENRGEEYLKEFKRFYELLPYVVVSRDFVACHAAPIKTRFNKDMLINIYQNHGLIHALTHNRLRRRNYPAGYQKGDVNHFKKELGVPLDTQFLVSHSPLNRTDPFWREAGGIKDHHIVFSANIPWVGVFTRINDRIIPLSYHREILVPLINKMS